MGLAKKTIVLVSSIAAANYIYRKNLDVKISRFYEMLNKL